MTSSERQTLIAHAVRWCVNILVEVLDNHGKVLPEDQRKTLGEAVVLLSSVRDRLL
jgi:hypothetical protein